MGPGNTWGKNMPKRRKYSDPAITYVHPSTGKLLLKQCVLKYGSLRQLALRLDMSVAHVYRLANNESRMKITWYNDIQRLLEQ
jgi:hypothetical protein